MSNESRDDIIMDDEAFDAFNAWCERKEKGIMEWEHDPSLLDIYYDLEEE